MSAKQIRRPTQPASHIKGRVWAVRTPEPDPNGNREQRRAARRLGMVPHAPLREDGDQ